MFKVIELGSAANAFIREKLSSRETLWNLLCRLPIEDGKVHAYVPFNFSAHDLKHLELSIIPFETRDNVAFDQEYRLKTLAFIHSYLKAELDRVAVFRYMNLPSDTTFQFVSPLRGFKYRRMHSPDENFLDKTLTEVYMFADHKESDIETLATYVECSATHPSIVLLTRFSKQLAHIVIGQELTIDQLQYLATGAEGIVMSSYNEDLDLIWTRNDSVSVDVR